VKKENQFVIDGKHELAKKIWDLTNGETKLTNIESFCNQAKPTNACMTWFNWSEPNCQARLLITDEC
jgi:hypothetical protein